MEANNPVLDAVMAGYIENPPETFDTPHDTMRFRIDYIRVDEDDDLLDTRAVVNCRWTGDYWFGRATLTFDQRVFEAAVLIDIREGVVSTRWIGDKPFEAYGTVLKTHTNAVRRPQPFILSARPAGKQNANSPIHVQGSGAAASWTGPRTPLANAFADLRGTNPATR